MRRRQIQFENPEDQAQEIRRFTWKEGIKLFLFWAASIAAMIWVAMEGRAEGW